MKYKLKKEDIILLILVALAVLLGTRPEMIKTIINDVLAIVRLRRRKDARGSGRGNEGQD